MRRSRKKARVNDDIILPIERSDGGIILPPTLPFGSRQRGSHKQQEMAWTHDAAAVRGEVQYVGLDVGGETFQEEEEEAEEEWDMGEGLSWEDISVADDDEDEEDEDRNDIAPGGTLLLGHNEAKLIGVNPDDPLFPGSPHSGRDLARYVMALKQTCGK